MSIDENENKDYSYIIDALREDWQVPSVRAEACLVIQKLMRKIEQMSNVRDPSGQIGDASMEKFIDGMPELAAHVNKDLLTPEERYWVNTLTKQPYNPATVVEALLCGALNRLAPLPKPEPVAVTGWDAIFDMKVNSSARYLNEGSEYRCKDGELQFLAFPTAGLSCKAVYTKSDLKISVLSEKNWYKIS